MSRRRRPAAAFVSIGALLACTIALGASGAPGTSTGTNGQIVFVRLSDGVPQATARIVVVDGSGRGERTLLRGAGHMLEHPDWSPDGTRIAFASCLFREQGRCRVGTVGADGKGLRYLQPECRSSRRCVERMAPAWSPDGRLLAFTRGWGGRSAVTHWNAFRDIYVMRADGRRERRVTRFAAHGPFAAEMRDGASWSPDGDRLVFDVTFAAATQSRERHAVYVVDLDGSDMRRITPWSLRARDPRWSPDGERIVLRGVPGGDPTEVAGNLYSVRPDGTDLRRLTHYPVRTPGAIQLGGYAPDGRSIVFSTTVGGTPGSFGSVALPETFDLLIMRADGTARRPVTRTPALDFSPDWGPAG